MTDMNRVTDTPNSPGRPVEIVRTIPMWGIVTMAGSLLCSAVGMYVSMQEWAHATQELTIAVKTLVSQMGVKDVKDAEHDARLAAHEQRLNDYGNRIGNLEQRR